MYPNLHVHSASTAVISIFVWILQFYEVCKTTKRHLTNDNGNGWEPTCSPPGAEHSRHAIHIYVGEQAHGPSSASLVHHLMQ